MIKFFRNIRRNLVREHRLTRYLLYAIGEIILVVFGILIALQINNWNEEQKLIAAEKATVASLKLEFEKNLIDLERNISAIEAIKNAGEILLEYTGPNYVDGSLQNIDSLISMTPRMSVWDPSLYTLNDIKNSGKLSNLANENLKIKLIEWESFYTNLLDWGDFYVDRGHKYFDFLMEHSVNRNLTVSRQVSNRKSYFNKSNEALMREILFENLLIHKVSMNDFMLGFYLDAKKKLQLIIEECETYED